MTPLDEEEIFSFLKKRAGLLDGVCITGGEPLLDPAIEDLISRIRSLGYKIKLDTNGAYPDRLCRLAQNGWSIMWRWILKILRNIMEQRWGFPISI